MALQPITNRSPISLNFLQNVSTDAKRLAKYDRLRLTPSNNAVEAGQDVALKIIQLLDQRTICPGRSVHSGSQVRGVCLKRPKWGDVDVVCFLHEDLDGQPIESFKHFEETRRKASKKIKEWLEGKLGQTRYFDEYVFDTFWAGLVLKLRVKRNRIAHHMWHIDIIFAYDLSVNNNIPQWPQISIELEKMQLFQRLTQTNSMAPWRNIFLNNFYLRHPRAKALVRILKAWNRMVMADEFERNHCVNSFTLEVLALLLLDNAFIPASFNLSKALATCLFALAFPSNVPALFFRRQKAGGDAMDRPAPPNRHQLAALIKNANKKAGGAEGGLVVVDPFAPFSNLATRRKNTFEAWKRLECQAAEFVKFLGSKNVTPYAINAAGEKEE